jgi:hypothetical protein
MTLKEQLNYQRTVHILSFHRKTKMILVSECCSVDGW